MRRKQTAVIICPGRGTYNKEELGYLTRFHHNKSALIRTIDEYRQQQGQATISELDQSPKYNMARHTAGENASPLIYGCAMGDIQSIDQEKYDILAITGNSMGWYIALAGAGALAPNPAIELINTMGSMMKDTLIGGQILYPVVDDDWLPCPQRLAQLESAVARVKAQPDCEVFDSIYLGGFRVLGANKPGLKALEKALPPIDDRFPMALYNHAAFHTPLLDGISQQAKNQLSEDLFTVPHTPLIDGRGHIWYPESTQTQALWDYTLGHQVNRAYDFSKAIEVAVKEFAPDKLIIPGPGTTLGGATAQCLIQHNWHNIGNKQQFIDRQKQDPMILSMGMEEQRKLVV